MNLKTLSSKLGFFLVLFMFVASSAFAGTIFVNNNGGVDSRTGQNDNVNDNVNGPVATITRALELAVADDFISVAYTAVPYTEPGLPGGIALINKQVTLTSTGAGANAVEISNITINPGANKTVTFSSLFSLTGNTGVLYLQTGKVVSGGNLTIGSKALIRRDAGTIDSAPVFAGTVNLQYDDDATVGPEFPSAADVAVNLTTTVGKTLTFDRDAQINGILNSPGAIVLGASTLTIYTTTGQNHLVNDEISATTGGLVFVNDKSNAALTTNVDVTATAGADKLTLPSVSFNANNAGSKLVLGPLNVDGAMTIKGDVSNTGIGILEFGNGPASLTIDGNLNNSSSGYVDVTITNATTIKGSAGIVNNGTVNGKTGAGSNYGVIEFGNAAVTLTAGGITNSGIVTGALSSSAAETIDDVANVIFGTGAVTVKTNIMNTVAISASTANAGDALTNAGSVVFGNASVAVDGIVENKTTFTGSIKTGSTVNSLGNILFGTIGNDMVMKGGITNASEGFGDGVTASGMIDMSARTNGKLTVGANGAGDLVNTSSATKSTNGDVNLGGTTGTTGVVGTVSLAGSVGTGDIIFGATPVTFGGVSITRDVTGAEIDFGAAVAVAHKLGLVNMAASKAKIAFGAQTGAGSIEISSLTSSAGTFELGGASTTTVTVSGNAEVTGGTFDFGTGAATVAFKGVSTNLTGAAFSATPQNASATLTFTRATSAQTLTTGPNTTWPGDLNVNNSFPVGPNFTFNSGNLNVNGTVTFSDNVAGTPDVDLANGRLILSGGGAVFNNPGGYTASSGTVTLQGTVLQTIAGTGAFAALEINNAAAVLPAPAATITSNITITGTLYLTRGQLSANALNITFDAATGNPTIVRNIGELVAGGGTLTFTDATNVVYTATVANTNTGAEYGANINNLTISSSGGSQKVTALTNATVKGTITVNAKQTLDLVATTLDMQGASVVNNGTIVNTGGVGVLSLNKATGTAITGSGTLPEISVANGSVGNTITGSTALSNGAALEALTLLGTGSITVGFTGNGPHVQSVTTATGTLTTSANLLVEDNIVIGAGKVELAGNLTFRDKNAVGSTINKSAVFSGDAKLVAAQQTTGAIALQATAAANMITVKNFELSNKANADVLNLNSDMKVTGTLTLTKGDLRVAGGKTLLIAGNKAVLNANATVTAPAPGTGIVELNAASGVLDVELGGNATSTITNLTVADSVLLSGSAPSLTVATAMIHSAGEIAFADKDIKIAGTFNRTGGTYNATTGYLEISAGATAFTQGTDFSIPNLKVLASLTLGTDKATVVAKNLYLGNGATFGIKPASDVRLTVGSDSSAVPTILVDGTGNLSDVPAFFAGKVNYTFTGANATAVNDNSKYWPTTAGLAQTVTLSKTNAADLVNIAKDRSIYGTNTLDLITGTLGIDDTDPATLTLVNGITIKRTVSSSIDLDPSAVANKSGVLSADSVKLVYTIVPNSAGGAVTTGAEFKSPNAVTSIVSDVKAGVKINDSRTVSGDIVLNENSQINAGKTVTLNGSLTVASGKTFTLNGNLVTTGNLALNGGLAGAGALTFSGSEAQILTIPTAGVAVTNITINKTGTLPTVKVVGGPLEIKNMLTFQNGLLDVRDQKLILPNPATAVDPDGLAFDRSAIIADTSKIGHVVGTIERQAETGDGAAAKNGRFEFPVGTIDGEYRPASITFTPDYVVGNRVKIRVNHIDESPGGVKDMPIDGGNDVTIGNYTDFYWLVSTFPSSLTSTQNFDMDLTANNIGFPYKQAQDLRMIRRQDGNAESNGWEMQGNANSHANYQIVDAKNDTTVVVRTVSGQGGLIAQGSRFTMGVPVQAPTWSAPSVLDYNMYADSTLTVQFTAKSGVIGSAITYTLDPSSASFATLDAATGLVTLKPAVADISADAYPVKVIATDANGFFSSRQISVTVSATPVILEFTSTFADTTVKAGTDFSFQYAAKGGDGTNYVYSIKSVTGVTSDTASITAAGLLTWSPKAADIDSASTITVQVISGTDTTNTVSKMTVVGNTAPVWASVLPDTTVYVGDTLKWTYIATDADNDEVSYKFIGNFPKDATLEPSTGMFSWAPKSALAFPVLIEVQATDGTDSISTEAKVTIEVITVAVNGTVKYNVTNKAIPNALVTLKDANGAVVDTDSTDADGKYMFAAVTAGEYTVTATKTSGFGGVLASDALEVQKYEAGDTTSLATALQMVAADVDESGEVDAIDALIILNRSVDNKLPSFTLADWQFETKAVKVTSAGGSADIMGICAGDARSDYNPAGGIAKASVSFDNTEIQKIKKSAEFKLPVSVREEAEVGSFTLKFRYPADQIEFLGVVGSGIVSNVNAGVISLAWANANKPLNIKEDGVLAQLRFKAVEGFDKGSEAGLELLDGSEITDVAAKTIASTIAVSSVEVGIPESFDLGQNYPNPFNPTTTIKYGLPANGKVSLTVFNTLGQIVETLVDTKQEAGEYEVKFNAQSMASGVYLYRIIVTGGAKDFVQTKKMLLLK